jgi:hypothetical protein
MNNVTDKIHESKSGISCVTCFVQAEEAPSTGPTHENEKHKTQKPRKFRHPRRWS